MKNIKVKSLGPIAEADINFGDLTFFVGPQASGKSILLQMVKLVTDTDSIEAKLSNYGYVWGTSPDNNLDRFFGEGMAGIWTKKTSIEVSGKEILKKILLPKDMYPYDEEKNTKIFYIPAQRVVCLNYGWPRYFSDYENSVPYVLRDFSEILRQYLEVGFTHGESAVFPQRNGHINGKLSNSINANIFHSGKVVVDRSAKKRLMLNINGLNLPFMTWSTGQKEFMPLLMSFYWLCTATNGRRDNINTVIIEEPEMGLHPDAIKSVLLQIIDLLGRGYRVIVSTHSPVLLEFAWAFNILKESKADDNALLELFDLDADTGSKKLAKGIIGKKNIKTYYFNNVDYQVTVKDISTLDAASEDLSVAEWGGLSSFASRASDIVSKIAANNG